MKLILFSATWKTGLLLIQQTLTLGDFVKAYIWKAKSIKVENSNLEIIVGELSDKEKLNYLKRLTWKIFYQ